MIVPFRVLGRSPLALALAFLGAAFWAQAAYADTITVAPATLPNATVDAAYSEALTATPSGMGPYTWTISNGTLPAGITLSTDNSEQATLSGTPTAGGASTFTVNVSDSNGDTAAAQVYTLLVNKLSPNITWANPADITYGTALSATQLNATSDVDGAFSYHPALGTVLSAGASQQLKVTFTPTDTTRYKTVITTVSINVNKADTSATVTNATAKYAQGTVSIKVTLSSTMTVSGGTATFALQDGNGDQIGSAAQSGAVVNGVTSASVSLSGVSVGSYTVVASYTGATNFNGSSASGTLTVSQAKPLITWKAPAKVPFGTALSATQLSASSAVAGTFTYDPASGSVLAVGVQTLTVTFTPTDSTNYTDATATQHVTVLPLKPTIKLGTNVVRTRPPAGSWTASYGTDHVTLSAQLTSPNSTAIDAGSVTFSVKKGRTVVGTASVDVTNSQVSTDFPLSGVHAGSYSVSASYGGGSSFAAVNGNGTLRVSKVTPTITWATPADVQFGTTLSDTQLNATATFDGVDVPGTFVYSPRAGRLLNPGTQSLAVTFRPASTTDFNIALGRVKINVTPATTTAFVSDVTVAHTAKQAIVAAHLASSGTVSGGTVKFTLSSGNTPIWTSSAGVSNGVGQVRVPIVGLSAGSYGISASYNGTTRFGTSTTTGTLTIT